MRHLLSVGLGSLGLISAPAAAALVAEYGLNYAGHTVVSLDGGLSQVSGPTVVFDSISPPSAAQRGFTSGDVNAIFGEAIQMTNTGVLSALRISVFNAGTSTGPLSAVRANIDLFVNNNPTGLGTPIGSFFGDVNFADPLNPGFFATINFTGLESLNLNLTTQDVVITQRFSNLAGGANRLGVVDFSTAVIGLSDPALYLSASDVNNGQAGWYNIGNPPSPFFMGLTVTLIPEPASLSLLALGGLVLRRRRA